MRATAITASGTKEEFLMATMSIPKKERDTEESLQPVRGQKREPLERYRLQVDRQTKSSFSAYAAAEKAGSAIKKSFPKVQVSVYDSQDSKTTVL
jgi:Tfp pilus assembly protein PilP